MNIVATIVGIVMVLMGGLWALQGLNLVGGSFMTGQTHWLVIGLIVLVVGVALLVWSRRVRRTLP